MMPPRSLPGGEREKRFEARGKGMVRVFNPDILNYVTTGSIK